MSKMSRHIYRQIERGELPMELEDDEYSYRKKCTATPKISFAGSTISKHANRLLISRTSARRRSAVDWSLEAEGLPLPEDKS